MLTSNLRFFGGIFLAHFLGLREIFDGGTIGGRSGISVGFVASGPVLDGVTIRIRFGTVNRGGTLATHFEIL